MQLIAMVLYALAHLVYANVAPPEQNVRVPEERFGYLKSLLSAYMEVEDPQASLKIMRLLNQWATYLDANEKTTRRHNEVALFQENYDEFLIQLVSRKGERKEGCSGQVGVNMMAIVSSNSAPVNSPCYEVHLTAQEQFLLNKVFDLLLESRIPDAKAFIADEAELTKAGTMRSRLFQADMAIMLTEMKSTGKDTCVPLWSPQMKLTPFQKFQVLLTYLNAKDSNLPKELKLDELLKHNVFAAVVDYAEGKDIVTRILLAIEHPTVIQDALLLPGSKDLALKCSKKNAPVPKTPRRSLTIGNRFASPTKNTQEPRSVQKPTKKCLAERYNLLISLMKNVESELHNMVNDDCLSQKSKTKLSTHAKSLEELREYVNKLNNKSA